MVTLRRAIGGVRHHRRIRQAQEHQGALRAISKTDKLFDIALCPGYVSDMRKAGIDVTYVELPSNKGHMASHADAAMWAPILGAFMKSL